MDNVDVGEQLPIVTKWWDADGVPAEPDTIVVTIHKPDGSTVALTKANLSGTKSDPANTALDVWSADVLANVAGLWRITASATTAGDTATPQEFMVLVGVEEATGWCGQWVTWADVERCGTPPDLDPAGQDLVLDQATEILYLLSGRRYPGICTATRALCYACHSCYPAICSCDPYPSVDLGGRYPVWAAWDVKLAGVLLAPTAYEIRGRRWLVRIDGDVWPLGLTWRAEDPDAFAVTWAYGRQPPLSGRLAAARYALEAARLCAGQPCVLNSQSATNVVREGVTYTVLDADSVIALGRTGLGSVDAWLVADEKSLKPEPHIYHPLLGASRRIV